jgi:hypothetical protein
LRRYGGCVSWLELDDEIPCDTSDVAPVMSETEFQERLSALVPLLCDRDPELVSGDWV